jgi:hypothetical protein
MIRIVSVELVSSLQQKMIVIFPKVAHQLTSSRLLICRILRLSLLIWQVFSTLLSNFPNGKTYVFPGLVPAEGMCFVFTIFQCAVSFEKGRVGRVDVWSFKIWRAGIEKSSLQFQKLILFKTSWFLDSQACHFCDTQKTLLMRERRSVCRTLFRR